MMAVHAISAVTPASIVSVPFSGTVNVFCTRYGEPSAVQVSLNPSCVTVVALCTKYTRHASSTATRPSMAFELFDKFDGYIGDGSSSKFLLVHGRRRHQIILIFEIKYS